MYVAPKTVSGRVVKTVIPSAAAVPAAAVGRAKVRRAPSERPIQFRCAVRVVSDQSSVSRLSSSRCAYSLMRKNHCSSSRCSTTVPHRSHAPATTCSLASTVLQLGHQFTAARFL
jgi:hypothetical protein